MTMGKKGLEMKSFNEGKSDGEEGRVLEDNDCDSTLPIRAQDVELSSKDEKKKSKKRHLVNSIDVELGASQNELEEKGKKSKRKNVETRDCGGKFESEAKTDRKRRRKEKNKDGSNGLYMIQEIKDKAESVINEQHIPGKEEAAEMLHVKEGIQNIRKEKKRKREKEGAFAAIMDNITDENDGRKHFDDRTVEKVKSKKDVKKKKQLQSDDLGASRQGIEGANEDKDCMNSGGNEAKGGKLEVSSVNAEDAKKAKKKKMKKVTPTESGSEEKGHKAGEKGKKGVKASVPSKNPAPNERSKKVSFSDHVEVFPSPDDDGNENVDQENGLVRGTRFSEEEDKLVKEAVQKYIEGHDLGEEGIEMIMHCSSYPETKNCWKEIGAALPWRPTESVYYRAHILFERDEKRSWTPEEYELIRRFHDKHGSDWRTLGDALGKHRIHVKDTWRRIKLPNMKKGHWSQEEYQSLFDLVNVDLRMKVFDERKTKHGMLRDNICWEAISDQLATRTNASCCRKWYYQLTSPMVAEGQWADADDYRLLDALLNLDACCIEDVEWDNLLEHRTGDICRKRWNQMHRHIGELGAKTFPEQVEVLSQRYCPDLLEVIVRVVMAEQKHRILMVSDFFYPNFGGVENHIYLLSQCLLKLGHKVVIMTHAYGNRSGVRYMTGGLKVYYVPWRPYLMNTTIPTLYGTLPIIRNILIRENISLVHGHQAFSTLCHEAAMHARTMGYKVVFTDHSLYGFADVGSIHMNKVLQFTLADVSQAICVSHTSKENTVLRSGLPPEKVFVIPNAVDTAMFKPAPTRPCNNEIIIVVISRLVYRKGTDLLVEVIPEVCHLYPNVRFIIGGDGPKRVRLEEMREKHSLQDRVEMLGAVPHANVRSVLISGHIFLNSSLTEAFCIAILEAASCGLLTVSTRVGGVPEVLPDDMIVLAEPDPTDMVQAIRKAISILPTIDPIDMHNRMKNLYNWHDVAKRTEIVYGRAMTCSNQTLLERLSRYLSCGAWAGKLFCLVMVIDFLFWRFLELLQPAEDVEEVPDLVLPHREDGEVLRE